MRRRQKQFYLPFVNQDIMGNEFSPLPLRFVLNGASLMN